MLAARAISTPCAVHSSSTRLRTHGSSRQHVRCNSSAIPGPDPQASVLAQMMMAYASQLQPRQEAAPFGAEIHVRDLTFHPPGAEKPLLSQINMHLPANRLGLVIGRSGSGKTTLLQMLSGLAEQNSGSVLIRTPTTLAAQPAQPATVEERMKQVGLVFQFPERHFLGVDILQELTFTWPREVAYVQERNELSMRVQKVMEAVGLEDIPLMVSPLALSGGQQRRLALAIQLVRQPALLLLDEPLAGLDWQARKEVVDLLRRLKKYCTVLVVSHDLAEIAPLVDCAWRMRLGGTCESVKWPPADLAGLDERL